MAGVPMFVRACPLSALSAELLMRLVLCGEGVPRMLRWASVARRVRRENEGRNNRASAMGCFPGLPVSL